MGALAEMSRGDLMNTVSRLRSSSADMRTALAAANAPSMTDLAVEGSSAFTAGIIDEATGMRASLGVGVALGVVGFLSSSRMAFEAAEGMVLPHLYDLGKKSYSMFVTSSLSSPTPATETPKS